jgi:signal transduction histidine kinase
MEVIIRSAMRLKEIIEDMSTISHKEEGQSRVRRSPLSLSKLAQDMVVRFEETAAEKHIEIGCDVPSQDPVVISGERDKIEVALSNLIRNALAFTDQGGQIGVKVESEGGYARVFVVDTGIGIPAG